MWAGGRRVVGGGGGDRGQREARARAAPARKRSTRWATRRPSLAYCNMLLSAGRPSSSLARQPFPTSDGAHGGCDGSRIKPCSLARALWLAYPRSILTSTFLRGDVRYACRNSYFLLRTLWYGAALVVGPLFVALHAARLITGFWNALITTAAVLTIGSLVVERLREFRPLRTHPWPKAFFLVGQLSRSLRERMGRSPPHTDAAAREVRTLLPSAHAARQAALCLHGLRPSRRDQWRL